MRKKHPQSSPTAGTNSKHKQTLCFSAGHSGRHIIPCLTLAQQQYAQYNLLFFTSKKELDCSLISASELAITHVQLAISQQRRWYTLPLLALSLAWATITSFFTLLAHMPERIITTGSIVAVPVCVAGWLLGIPIELFELNAHAGKTMHALSYTANTIRHCFARTQLEFPRAQCILTPYPIRFAPQAIHPIAIPHFTPDRITLFVQGGSQGSQEINALMKKVIEDAPELHEKLQVIHQAGAHLQKVTALYEQAAIPAHVFSFESHIAPYYQAADLIMCRAGAGTLFEALHFQKRTITVPLITRSNTHQLQNAQAMAQEHPELFSVLLQQDGIEKIKKICNELILVTHTATQLL